MRLALLLLASCGAGATPPVPEVRPARPARVEPIVTPLPIVTHIDEPPPVPPPPIEPVEPAYEPTSFVATVAGQGRPVILIPGIGCPANVWDETIAHLGGRYETHALTLSGFAGRPAIGAPLNATVRDELARYIRDRKLDRPIVIGHSMGGFLALWLAAAEPELVGPTVVVDASPALGDGADLTFLRDLSDAWRHETDAEFAQDARDYFSLMAFDTSRLAPVVAAVGRSDHRAFADAFMELFTTDIRPQMSRIRAPVLLVIADTGADDVVRFQTHAIPSHEVVMLPHTRHFVFFDDPIGFYANLDRFLAAHP